MELLPKHQWKIEPVIVDGKPTGQFEISCWTHNNYRQFVLVEPPMPMSAPQPWVGRPMQAEEIKDVMGRWAAAMARPAYETLDVMGRSGACKVTVSRLAPRH